jgi:hypothetical protein
MGLLDTLVQHMMKGKLIVLYYHYSLHNLKLMFCFMFSYWKILTNSGNWELINLHKYNLFIAR